MATRSIRGFDKAGQEHRFDTPSQMVGYDFVRVEIDKGDWSQDQIREYIRPTLARYGGELREW